ncbi:glycosyltransferase family 87 protein [Rhodococcus sp. MEB064]|uniref:glycosyltransferase family 87 protein n=1 Tax=Rhodococcus sp. MEB064 TaxID=1587522 RepID=UPI0005AC6E3C|nr:glycosyltransferase family 87 protein [Rhodococcus sp. MEB064]
MASPGELAQDRRSARRRDRPSLTDPMVGELSSVVGGPIGKHALVGRQRHITPLRVIFAFTVVFLALGWFGKAACIQQAPIGPGGELGLDWSGSRQYVAMCYSDVVPLYGAERLDQGAFPYKKSWEDTGSDGSTITRYMEYPVVAGMYQYVSMQIAHAWSAVPWLPQALTVALYFNVVAFGSALAWIVTIWATTMLAGRRVWDSALAACSPLVIVHVFTNFDALATAFAAGGMLAWARRRPVLAGILLGIGGATKLYPLFLLGPLLVLCLRTGNLRDWTRTAAAAVSAWVLINLPIALLFPRGWSEFFRLNSDRGADPDSIYNVVRSFTGWSGFDGPLAPGEKPVLLNLVTAVLFIAACAAVAYVGMTAPRRPRLAQLGFLVVAGFLLTNKVWSPQYSLWLVPLAVLALPHRRILLAWMTIDALVWVPRMMYYLGVSNKGLPEQYFTTTVVFRDLAVVALCVLIVRQIYRPVDDLVRSSGDDDPAGGVLDGAPDSYPAWVPASLRPRPVAVPVPEHVPAPRAPRSPATDPI